MRRLRWAWLLLSLVALGGPAAVSSATGTIACTGAHAVAIPCCGPPPAGQAKTAEAAVAPCCLGVAPCCLGVAPCCGAATHLAIICPRGLTIGSNPDPSTAGHPVTITGHLFSASTAGVTVVLWQRLPKQPAFQQVLQTTTDSSGDYTIVRRAGAVQVNRMWYVTAAPGLRSVTVVQSVRALVRLTTPTGRAGLGKPLTLTCRVTPSHAGEQAVLEQRTANGWKPIAAGRLGRGSKLAFRHGFGHKGAVLLRVLMAGDGRNSQSYSGPVAIKIG